MRYSEVGFSGFGPGELLLLGFILVIIAAAGLTACYWKLFRPKEKGE